MRDFRSSSRVRTTACLVAMSVLALVLFAPPSEAGVCERALKQCLMEAGLAALIGLLTSGPIPATLLGQFCVGGYLFCLQYY